MNPNEPHSFVELASWLERVKTLAGYPLPPCPEGRALHKSAASIAMSLRLLGGRHDSAIETAADKLWLHEAEAFQGLTPEEASRLQLRISTATDWIGEFVTTEECPFDYPNGSFQEVVHWLLVDWWQAHGIYRASNFLFLLEQ